MAHSAPTAPTFAAVSLAELQANFERALVAKNENLTLRQAASLLQQSEMTVRRRIADGSLPAYRVGPRGLRVKRSDVEALMRRVPAA